MSNESSERKLSVWLFNPAVYIAGMEALIAGIGIIMATSWIGSLSRTHFDGVLDVHTGAGAPRWFFIVEGLLAWLSVVILFWIVGKLAGRTSFRLVDLAGTQAVARAPMLFVSIFALLPGYARFSQKLMTTALSGAAPSAESFLTPDAAWFVAVLAAIVVTLCWAVALMYRSYAHVCNIRGGRAVGSFIIALILAEVLSKVFLFSLGSRSLTNLFAR